MQTMTKQFSQLPKVAYFAGFGWPRYVATLPPRDQQKRLRRYKQPAVGPYYHQPEPIEAGDRETFFYLQSDFCSGLRWSWCDELPSDWNPDTHQIDHTGWFADIYQGSTIRGIVAKLPKNRGYLPGWSIGEGMASVLDAGTVYDDASDAARVADKMAENAAELNREDNDDE